MKKILFLVLMLTVAFSQFDNTIAGWYNEHYYVPEGSVYSEGLVVADESSLGSESLAETDFATHAFWTGTNDIDDTGGNAAYTWSANQTSTLTQIQAELATAGVGDRWYVFTYTVAVTTAFDGDGAATITTGFASSAVSLSLVVGTHTVYFKSKTAPVDFVISVVSGSDTEGTWTIDDVTLKQIIGGNVEAYGLFTGGGSTGLKIDSDGNARLPKALFLDEKASQETIVAGEGQYWVMNTAPTIPMFTDDDGDDHALSSGGTRHIHINNADLGKGATAPTQAITGNFQAWSFGINDDAVIVFDIPHDWNGSSDFSIDVCYFNDEAYATNSGEVQWEVSWRAVSEDEIIDSEGASGTIDSGDIDLKATAKDKDRVTLGIIAAASLTIGDNVGLILKRVVLDGGNDPTAGEPEVICVDIHYTAKY